ncbi:PLP-dependent transferase [Colletotrichum eremochloae]|nr:PLP-dependent transferase [Colletotrichum eremochloae]
MDHGLSARGREAAKPDDGMLLWTIVQDLWDPRLIQQATLSEHIHNHLAVPNHSFTYGDGMTGSKRLKETLSRFLTERLKPTAVIEPQHISVTNGCSSAIEHLAWALGNPGDGFLLGQPHYGSFLPDVEYRTGYRLVQVPFHDVDPFGLDAVQTYEDSLLAAQKKGTRIAAIILCHPHNPLGRCYPRETIIELMRLCQRYNMHLISDEIYALSTWNNTIDTHPKPVPYESCLSIDMTGIMEPHRLHVLWGIDYAQGANAAFFLWVNLGKAYRERHPQREIQDLSAEVMHALLARKVFLASGNQFGSEQPGWFRIVFSNKTELLLEGLERITAVINN